MVEKIHRIQESLMKSKVFYKVLNFTVNGFNLLVRIGLVLLALWAAAAAQ